MGAESRTFFITGVSSGLGRAISAAALDAGHRVVGTVRRAAHGDSFQSLSVRAVAVVVDVTDHDGVTRAVNDVETNLGPIDVVIANAGYGQEGTIEESTLEDLRSQFNVNVFGAVSTIKSVLPHMRARRSGHIIAVTSMGGLRTSPGLGFYQGSKYALEGIVETLAKEVGHLGIRVTAVEPGGFRTEWAGRSMIRTAAALNDYEPVLGPILAARRASSGHQPGDPAKAGKVILQIIDSERPPRHLLLGSDALRLVREGRAEFDAEVAEWESLTRSTDYE